MNHIIRAFLLFLLASIVQPADAQFYQTWHRPSDVSYRVLSTRHFRVIYQMGLREEAEEMVNVLEATYPAIKAAVGLRRPLHVPVVLNSFTDRGNGFVTSLPFRQEIEAVALRGKVLSPRFHSWFETVAPHELVHAAHAESGRGFGIGWMLRLFGPDLARSLNLSAPRGINEGAAVWYESQFHAGAGRLNHALFEMEFRAAMLSNDPWHLAQMLEPPSYTRPFDRYYHGGAYLFQYMVEQEGDVEFFRRARNFYYRFPLLGYGPALWYGTRMMPHILGSRLRSYYGAEAETFVDGLGDLTQPEVIASERGTVFRRPVWIDGKMLLVFARGYHMRPGFYRVHAASGDVEPVAFESISEDFLFRLSSDSSSVLFSRYVPDMFEPIRSTAEVYELDLASGDAERITRRARIFAPVTAPDGHIWGLKSGTPYEEWVQIDHEGVVQGIESFDRTSLISVLPSPTSGRVAALINRSGEQAAFEIVSRDGTFSLEPLLVFRDASVYDISWGPTGDYLLASADPGGVANIYALDMRGGLVYRLTNVPFGAIEPSLSPDGSTLAFVNYRHERYELVQIPFKPEDVVPTHVLASETIPTALENGATSGAAEPPHGNHQLSAGTDSTSHFEGAESPYVPLLNIRPRVFYPFLLYQRPTGDDDDAHLGFGVGAGIEWADPLQYWTAHTSAFYQRETVWGRLLVRSGRFLLRPSFELYREPSTVTVQQLRGGETEIIRVGRDERGVGIGLRLPAVFESNVFQTTAVASVSGEYSRERLFDAQGETIRAADDRLTVRPTLQVNYKVQANVRDIVPNAGLQVGAFSRIDVWTDQYEPARYVQVQSHLYLPFLRGSSTGIALKGSLHAQNRGGIIDLATFFPRGYETETVYLGEGLYSKVGLEITQPLWYIDDGFFLLPLYFRALFAYAFAESLQPISGADGEVVRTVVGGGLGLQARFGHGINFTLRVAPAYRLHEKDWAVTFR